MDVDRAKELFSALFSQEPPVPCAVRLWDGSEVSMGPPPRQFVLHLKSAKAAEAVLGDPSFGFGEAYMAGDVDVEGSLEALVSMAYRHDLFSQLPLAQKARLGWMGLKRRASLRQTRADVQSHYDRGNDFYRLWLDDTMTYSCAYFCAAQDTLELAQRQKLRHVLRKLRLQPGQRLLDIGCGWGSLVIEAARDFGVEAVGLTLAENQFNLARERVAAADLSGRVDIRLLDYREMPQSENGSFDAVASVGMFEHVGKANIPVFFERTKRLLRPQAPLLLHTLGRPRAEPMDPWLLKHIFPGSYLPAIGEVAEAADAAGLDFVDLEDLRPHYDITLGHWIQRFEVHADEIRRKMGEAFVRMWRLYLHGCRMSLRHGSMHVFQFLLSAGRRHDWPLTRDWTCG